VKLEITEEDHRRIDAAVAEHDPTGWLMTTRIRLFSEEDADWYANFMRPGLRGAVVSAMIGDALRDAITELGGTFTPSHRGEIEGQIREIFELEGEADINDRERWSRVLKGTTDGGTDEAL
jgi:hypothetical protein